VFLVETRMSFDEFPAVALTVKVGPSAANSKDWTLNACPGRMQHRIYGLQQKGRRASVPYDALIEAARRASPGDEHSALNGRVSSATTASQQPSHVPML
jgi:hypothetical protein